MLKRTNHLHTFLLLLVAGLFLSTCGDRTINPFEDDEGIYSVYGALEVGKDQNVIRVRNLLEPFNSGTTFPLDAIVTFTDLQTNITTQLRDTTVDFEIGRTHNFILNEELELDSQYKLTVERSDGATVETVVTTPGLTQSSFTPPNVYNCETQIQFRFDNVHSPEFLEMEVGVFYQGKEHWAAIDLVGMFEYDPILDMIIMNMRPRNLLVEIFPPPLPDDPEFDFYFLNPLVWCDDLDREYFMFRYKHYGPEWGNVLKEGMYRPLDIETGAVENGLGFLGAYRTGSFSFEFVQPSFSDTAD